MGTFSPTDGQSRSLGWPGQSVASPSMNRVSLKRARASFCVAESACRMSESPPPPTEGTVTLELMSLGRQQSLRGYPQQAGVSRGQTLPLSASCFDPDNLWPGLFLSPALLSHSRPALGLELNTIYMRQTATALPWHAPPPAPHTLTSGL